MKLSKSDMEDYAKHFKESDFWKKVKSVSKAAGVKIVYSALLLFYVLKDEHVPKKSKWIIYGALGYFILPTDIIPDYIPVLGFFDDLTVLLIALGEVTQHITPEIMEKAKNKLTEWFGAFDEKEVQDIDEKLAD